MYGGRQFGPLVDDGVFEEGTRGAGRGVLEAGHGSGAARRAGALAGAGDKSGETPGALSGGAFFETCASAGVRPASASALLTAARAPVAAVRGEGPVARRAVATMRTPSSIPAPMASTAARLKRGILETSRPSVGPSDVVVAGDDCDEGGPKAWVGVCGYAPEGGMGEG